MKLQRGLEKERQEREIADPPLYPMSTTRLPPKIEGADDQHVTHRARHYCVDYLLTVGAFDFGFKPHGAHRVQGCPATYLCLRPRSGLAFVVRYSAYRPPCSAVEGVLSLPQNLVISETNTRARIVEQQYAPERSCNV